MAKLRSQILAQALLLFIGSKAQALAPAATQASELLKKAVGLARGTSVEPELSRVATQLDETRQKAQNAGTPNAKTQLTPVITALEALAAQGQKLGPARRPITEALVVLRDSQAGPPTAAELARRSQMKLNVTLPSVGASLPLSLRPRTSAPPPSPIVRPPMTDRASMGTRIYVADPGHNRIVEVSDRLGLLGSLSGRPNSNDTLRAPAGVAVDQQQRIYIADTDNHRIIRVNDITGSCFTPLGRFGDGFGKFRQPMAIAVDSQNRIYVADTGNHRIVRIDDMDGGNWTSYGSFGDDTEQFYNPRSVLPERDGSLVIADTNNHRIVRVTNFPRGNFSACCDIPSDQLVFNNDLNQKLPAKVLMFPVGLAQDAAGRYYVSTGSPVQLGTGSGIFFTAQRIVRLDDISGRNMVSLGSGASTCDLNTRLAVAGSPKQFLFPQGMAFTSAGKLLISDAGNYRLIEVADISGAGWRSIVGPAVSSRCEDYALRFPSAVAPILEQSTPANTCPALTCRPGFKLCDGHCVDLEDPRYGCAPSGCVPCTTALADTKKQWCEAGSCRFDSCTEGNFDLDGIRTNGCEYDARNVALWLAVSSGARETSPVGGIGNLRLSADFGSSTRSTASGFPSMHFGTAAYGTHISMQSDVAIDGEPFAIFAVVQRDDNRSDNDFLISAGGGCDPFSGCRNDTMIAVGWQRDTQACLHQWGDDVCVDVPAYNASTNAPTLFHVQNDGRSQSITVSSPHFAPVTASRRPAALPRTSKISIGGSAWRDQSENYFVGHVLELFIVKGDLSLWPIEPLRVYLSRKYGMRIPLR